MLLRLLGLAIIICAVIVPLALIAIALTIIDVINDIEATTRQRREALAANLLDTENSIERLTESVNGSLGQLESLVDSINFDDLPLPSINVPASLSFSLPGLLPDVSVPIPFASEINNLPDTIRDTLESSLKEPFSAIAEVSSDLSAVFDNLRLTITEARSIQTDVEARYDEVWLGRIRSALWVAVIVGVFWMVTSLAEGLYRGWALLAPRRADVQDS